MIPTFTCQVLFLVIVFAQNAKTDVSLHDALPEKDKIALGSVFKEVLEGVIISPKNLHQCDLNVDNKLNYFENCISRYFQLKTEKELNRPNYQCATVKLVATSFDYTPEVCYSLNGAFWYGGAELQYQRWPIQGTSLPMQPFVTNDIVPLNQSFGNVIDRYWFNSKGIGLRVDENVPLFVSFNNSRNEICFQANHRFINLMSAPQEKDTLPFLKYEMCKADNVKEIYKLHTSSAMGMPDERMFKSPIWSTWAKYKVDIDEVKVLQYAKEIIDNGFSNSQIEIDDMFSTHYGDFNFTPEKFKNPKEMIKKLKNQGFRVTVWITPFANFDSPVFVEGMQKGYWLKDVTGEVPALVKWWQGVGGILDVENEEAIEWYVKRLRKMKENYGIDSFKFDAGEVTYLPPVHEYSFKWQDQSIYTTKYVAAVSKLGPMIEVSNILQLLSVF